MVNDAPVPEDDGLDEEATEAFFEALAGRTPKAEGADAKSQAIMGDLMRNAILMMNKADVETDPDPEQQERLMQRLRARCLFKDSPP